MTQETRIIGKEEEDGEKGGQGRTWHDIVNIQDI